MRNRPAWIIALSLLAAVPAFAQGRLSPEDRALYQRALEAARDEDWESALGLAARGDNPVASKIVRWDYLSEKDSGASFAEISKFIADNPDWPAQPALRRRAEEAMPRTLPAQQVVAFFAGREPEGPDGQLKLGEALLASGDKARGQALIRKAWIGGDFNPNLTDEIVAKYGAFLDREAHVERLSRLLYDRNTSEARQTAQLVDDATRKLAEARIKFITGRGSSQAVALVPDSLRNDPGLLFEQVRYQRKMGSVSEAQALVLRGPSDPSEMIRPEMWWDERGALAREAIAQGDYARAYRIAAANGLSKGVDFAEAEFLAGWLALRKLNKPDDALRHFQRLRTGVAFPVSVARAHYWAGRAYTAMKRPEDAKREYGLAAQFPETFYGQIALATSTPGASLRLRPDPAATDAAAFERREMVQAIRILADLGRDDLLRTFVLNFAEVAPTGSDLRALAEYLNKIGRKDFSVRVGKRALQRNMPVVSLANPVIALPNTGGTPETALVLALIRQESEFNSRAVSPAGAEGLMQVLPSTAKSVASSIGVAFRRDSLLDEPDYNVRLGMAYLAKRLDDFSGSYILTLASYNAGAGRVRQWLDEFGDPRAPGMDPIDWIERIPFNETREYVQRILENTQVYRNRLAGEDQKLLILDDLKRTWQTPAPPVQRANAETVRRAADVRAAPAPAPAAPQAPASPAVQPAQKPAALGPAPEVKPAEAAALPAPKPR